MIAALLFLALAAPPDPAWQPFEFLLGEWTAEGGGFSFRFDLDNKILVRRNFAESPAGRHEDLRLVGSDGGDRRRGVAFQPVVDEDERRLLHLLRPADQLFQ